MMSQRPGREGPPARERASRADRGPERNYQRCAPTRYRQWRGTPVSSLRIPWSPRSCHRALRSLPAQVGLDELVDLAVEDTVDVAGLVAAAEVFDHAVRLQHVAADLAAEVDVLRLAADRRELRFALLPLEVEQLRLEHLHRTLAVLVLAALVLAGHDDAGREVRDAHRGVGLVDVLAA